MTALADSKENIQYCNQTITSAMQSDKDFMGGSVMIVFLRGSSFITWTGRFSGRGSTLAQTVF